MDKVIDKIAALGVPGQSWLSPWSPLGLRAGQR